MKTLSPLLLGVDSGLGSSASSTASSTSPRCLHSPQDLAADTGDIPGDISGDSPQTSASPTVSLSPPGSPKHQAVADVTEDLQDLLRDAVRSAPDPEGTLSAKTSPSHDQRCPQAAKEEQKSDENDIERNFRFLLESLGFTCDPREEEPTTHAQSSLRSSATCYRICYRTCREESATTAVLRRVGRRAPASSPPPTPAPSSSTTATAATATDDPASQLKRTTSGPASSLRQRGIRPHQRNLLSLQQLRQIKNLVDQAVAEQKIFSICGAFPSVREALKSRGWLEKKWVPNECHRERPGDRERERDNREKENKEKESEKDKENKEKDGEKEKEKEKGADAKDRFKSEESMLSLLDSLAGEELNEKAVVARLLRGVPANFIWTVKFDGIDWKRLKKRQIINRFPKAFFTTKIGLSTFLRQMHWFSEEGVSLTRFPRCYNICQPDDMEAFVDDFRLTACLNTLKWLVDVVDKGGANAVASPGGKVPKMAVEFALTRCREFLVEHTNEDLDRAPPPTIFQHQWDQFLSWTYQLHRADAALSALAPEPSISALYAESCWVLERIAPLWPQLQMDGRLNVWIIKPGAKSRGRGIHLLNRLDLLTAEVSSTHLRDSRYVAQKYIERPLLIFGTKFDIRQWFLVTSVYPMTIWMYRESYLRFCSQSFSLQNMHESVHLCNNAVQAKYTNDGKRDPALPDENMWDCYTFQTYLRAMGRADLWDSVIYPGMRQGVVGSLLASQEHMDRRGDCFELFGADFMLTEDFVPWLIEINSCPCMAPSTSVTARMCAQCLEDVIKVVIDRRGDRNADTGMFELVYRQQIPPPPPYLGMSLSVRGRKIPSNTSGPRRRKTTSSPSDADESRCRRSETMETAGRHTSPATPATPGATTPVVTTPAAPGPPHSNATPRRLTLEPARAQAGLSRLSPGPTHGLAAVGTQLARVTRCASTLSRRRRHRQYHLPTTAKPLPLLQRQRQGSVTPTTPLLAVGMSLRPQVPNPPPNQPPNLPPNQ